MTQQQQQKQNSASLAKWARIKIISKVFLKLYLF